MLAIMNDKWTPIKGVLCQYYGLTPLNEGIRQGWLGPHPAVGTALQTSNWWGERTRELHFTCIATFLCQYYGLTPFLIPSELNEIAGVCFENPNGIQSFSLGLAATCLAEIR